MVVCDSVYLSHSFLTALPYISSVFVLHGHWIYCLIIECKKVSESSTESDLPFETLAKVHFAVMTLLGQILLVREIEY